jgi:hypothetical protein
MASPRAERCVEHSRCMELSDQTGCIMRTNFCYPLSFFLSTRAYPISPDLSVTVFVHVTLLLLRGSRLGPLCSGYSEILSIERHHTRQSAVLCGCKFHLDVPGRPPPGSVTIQRVVSVCRKECLALRVLRCSLRICGGVRLRVAE